MSVPLFAVLGDPIEHSLSPSIYKEFAEQQNIQLNYKKIKTTIDSLPLVLKDLAQKNYQGLNITAPLKQLAFTQVERVTDRARHARAVNTITFTEEGLLGDNTDGIGFIRDILQNHCFALKNKKILILGAGGAVRGILRPLLGYEPRLVMIASRTKPQGLELAEYFKPWGKVRACRLNELKARFDVIIQATSAGLSGLLPEIPEKFIAQDAQCYDLNYQQAAKPFLQWALATGAVKAVDGLGMLIEQAAEAFFNWHKIRPETEPVIRDIRMALNKQDN